MYKNNLKKQYDNLINLLGMKSESGYNNVNFLLRDMLKEFMKSHKRVGIYCYGEHTQMLMADFIADIREAVCVIDNGNVSDDSEFVIIRDSDIKDYNLDGVIVSTFKLRNEIKEGLYKNHSSIDVLDIYEELERYDVFLEKEFYNAGAYQTYTRINTLQCQLEEEQSLDVQKELLEELLYIKEFRLAEDVAKEIYEFTKDELYQQICEMISDIYQLEIKTVENSAKNNTLLLCLDGMRRDDFNENKLNKVYSLLKDSSRVYKNAYSYSTMTFESLVPVFSENTNQKTKYFLKEEVDSSECRFIDKAVRDNRFIAFYGDGNHYVYDDSIKYIGNSQTITEKLWDFALDVDGIDNGLFYLHELYESHYSFANPYTNGKLVSNGSAMLFDYLPQNKGYLRTDYKMQHEDALRYLDDTLAPFIEVLPCNIVIFADHGNLILEPGTERDDIKLMQLTASEDWIRIPLLIRTSNTDGEEEDGLISLMELNDIMLSVISGEEYEYKENDYIKIGRSAIYNQQFKELYRLLDLGYNGEAFEGFIFKEGYKLLVYDDGRKELYTTIDDERVNDNQLIDLLYNKIKKEITIF